ncbi:MAG: hypothetical protein K1W26_07985 [Acetatifactor sp.]
MIWRWTGYLCVLLLLAWHGVSDIREQHIPGRSLALGVALSCFGACWRGLQGETAWIELGMALLPGMAALVLARITGEQIGRGDAWELLFMGNCLGLADCLLALGIALVGIFLVSVVLLLLGRAGRNTRIAFVPFLWAGAAAALLIGTIRI